MARHWRDLPWPEPKIPSYQKGSYGSWKCKPTPTLRDSIGYFLPHAEQAPGWMITRNGAIWMSLTKMETESHMPHIAAAHGHVVICGLGMGFVLYNMLRKYEVTKVTVIEKDFEVGKLMDHVSNWGHWEGRDKLNIRIQDATTAISGPRFNPDFLYVDIWDKLGYDGALRVTKQIQDNVQAKSVGWWGQEFDFVYWCRSQNIELFSATRRTYREFAESTGMPLIERNSLLYPRLAIAAVTWQLSGRKEVPPHERKVLQRKAVEVLSHADPLYP